MELNIAEIILESRPSPFWNILKQIGVNKAIGVLPRGFNDWRQFQEEYPWDYGPLMRYKNMLEDNGLKLVGIEDNPPMDGIRFGIPKLKEEQLEYVLTMLENMGKLGIKLWCYNWMAGFGWSRTHTHIRGENGEFVSSFNIKDVENAPMKYGKVEASTLWKNLKDFLEYVVPIAEKYGIKLAMHPDDPPIEEYRGIARIMNSIENYDKYLNLVKSEFIGITFCQGNFTLMTDDLPSAIRHFGNRIFFVHFRDVKGNKYNFVETLIGKGKTNLVEVMKAYIDINFNGVMRVDHTPTLENDMEFLPGYSYLGRIYSIGYIKGLFDSLINNK
ncbi:TIM barrel protein [Acidianus sulfidivorans JP7]|uniref:mannonate dehydratase n=1 Tax=Acidianus sulfidivorans JP7 TaxID=619593 RepID=A0A2U9ILI4_9CREN|nr:mannonate dehydratase [Acidianus sulfidivorans]AWR96877.1 TIM barrel protein [Acidianus sulfidivorans JP7]